MPFDKLGFALDSTPPRHRFSPDIDAAMQSYRDGHRAYTVRTIPTARKQRVGRIADDVWPASHRILLPLALIGVLFCADPAVWVGVASVPLLILAYLLYWTPPDWTIYYLEANPVLCFLTVVGCVKTLETVARRGSERVVGWVLTATALVGCLCLAYVGNKARKEYVANAAYYTRFDDALSTLPGKVLVFVRYGPQHNNFMILTRNQSELSAARLWIINDAGPSDSELRRLAPARAAYIFDERNWTLIALPPTSSVVPLPRGHPTSNDDPRVGSLTRKASCADSV